MTSRCPRQLGGTYKPRTLGIVPCTLKPLVNPFRFGTRCFRTRPAKKHLRCAAAVGRPVQLKDHKAWNGRNAVPRNQCPKLHFLRPFGFFDVLVLPTLVYIPLVFIFPAPPGLLCLCHMPACKHRAKQDATGPTQSSAILRLSEPQSLNTSKKITPV